uniref:Major sperm protein n=1 Tax=Meloidogyne enterolobii TaxID=390850 RepID=A0A6V7XG70_MELEN|nr:unnamed protein product [Meloidogyne enterolobii]
MIVLHLLQVLISAVYFAATVGTLCGSLLLVGCSKKKNTNATLPTYVLEVKDWKEKKDPKDRKDPTRSKEDILKKDALPPPPKPAKPTVPPTTPAKGAASPLDGSTPGKTPSTPNMDEKNSPRNPVKDKRARRRPNLHGTRRRILNHRHLCKVLRRKSQKNSSETKRLCDGMFQNHWKVENMTTWRVRRSWRFLPMNCFSRVRTAKDQRKELQRLEEILFLINHLHLCRAKWVNSTRNLNLANLAVPEEINYNNVKYNVEQQASVELINESDVPAAIKIKSTDANIYRVIPVFRTIEPGGKSLVQIIRMPSAPKSDLIEVVAAPMTEGPLPDGGIPAIFKIVDVKDHKIIKIPVQLI